MNKKHILSIFLILCLSKMGFSQQKDSLTRPEILLEEITPNSLKISWKEIDRAAGYEIILIDGKTEEVQYMGNNGLTFTSLKEGFLYTVKVRAFNDTIHSKQGESHFITPPLALEAKKNSSADFVAVWKSDKKQKFKLYVSENKDFTSCLLDYNGIKVTKNMLKIKYLKKDSVYYYRLQTLQGSFSNTIMVRTKK